MKKMITAALLVAAFAGQALAGAKYTYTVSVNTTNRSASGAMGSARGSAATTQSIGCQMYGGLGVGAATVNCGARSAAGQYLYCSSNDPTLVGIAHSLTASSYIYFMADATGHCTYLDVEAESYFMPVTP